MKLLLLVFVLTGCGVERGAYINHDKTDLTFNHDDFQPYVELFVTEAWAQGIAVDVSDITVSFESLEPPVIGVCYTGYKHIKIDPKWNDMGHMRRLTLMFHELGHCALGRGHTDELSIMRPILLSPYTVLLNEDELLEELFHPNLQLADSHIHSEFCGGVH